MRIALHIDHETDAAGNIIPPPPGTSPAAAPSVATESGGELKLTSGRSDSRTSLLARDFLLSFSVTPAACALLARIAAGRICVLGSGKVATKPQRSGRRTRGAARGKYRTPIPGDGTARRGGRADAPRDARCGCRARSSRSLRLPPKRKRSPEKPRFFSVKSLDADAATRRVHLLRSWEVKPMAQLSPPTDAQASQLAALFAMIRHESPLIVTSAEALMTRTIPRTELQRIDRHGAIGDRLDLDALVEALASCGYQRVPQTEEAGRFQRTRRNRRCVLAALSRSDSHRARRRS